MKNIKWPTLIAAALVSSLLWLAAIAGLRSCFPAQQPAAVSQPSAPAARSEAASAATASVATIATTSSVTRIAIKRPAVPTTPQAGESAQPEDDIVIEVSSTTTASSDIKAVSAATASAQLNNVDPIGSAPAYGRLGVLVGTMPGIVAASFQLVEADIPPWVAGLPLKASVDAEANLEQLGAGVSLGGKGFVTALAWSRWNLSAQGFAVGAGMRF